MKEQSELVWLLALVCVPATLTLLAITKLYASYWLLSLIIERWVA